MDEKRTLNVNISERSYNLLKIASLTRKKSMTALIETLIENEIGHDELVKQIADIQKDPIGDLKRGSKTKHRKKS